MLPCVYSMASVLQLRQANLFNVGWDAPGRTLRNSTIEKWEAAGKPEQPVCSCCEEKHIVRVAQVSKVTGEAEVYLEWAVASNVAFHKEGGQPCQCFEPDRWFEGGLSPPTPHD